MMPSHVRPVMEEKMVEWERGERAVVVSVNVEEGRGKWNCGCRHSCRL